MTVPQLRALLADVTRDAAGATRAARIAQAGARFAREQLSPSALHCYWLLTLEHYVRLYDGYDGLRLS